MIKQPDEGHSQISKEEIKRSPLMTFNELYPHSEFTFVSNDTDHFARFKCFVKIGDETFQGTGNYK